MRFLNEVWVIRGPKGFVAPPGSPQSYTRNKAGAVRFGSFNAAKAQCCGNERPTRL